MDGAAPGRNGQDGRRQCHCDRMPVCMVNMEDAIKTSGLEGEMEAIDLVELIDRHLAA